MTETRVRTEDLRVAIEHAGYYPGLVIDAVASALTQHLGLLFVPAAVGVVLFLPQLRAHASAVALALVGSVVLTIAVSGLVLKLLGKERSGDA